MTHIIQKKLEKHEKACENHHYCCVEMLNEDNKILKYKIGKKSMKVPFIIYAALSVCLKKMTLTLILNL